ncbi:DUF2637 domain-containing protein [Streptomyces sp. C10-9-1]|uniref:DUF2637 domain-containing protein n=1 Tax=Streptomyces sp. C10-9-1 TaxID=1859285 RepID=UPI0021133AE6|nr:DUF2637 domain-containing protein [Streptomyces sp. C10-9-1]MCQ6554731.1 DUF2637 domain-containing protein [Streptomyces sp. C10-9-1]
MLTRLRQVDPILVQAVIAAALSFAHIHDVAEAAGQGGWKAWAYPVSVDVLLAVAWKMMRTRGGAAAWFWFLTAMAASLGANVATSGVMDLSDPPGWLRVVVAGWPAVAFLGGTLLVHRSRDAAKEGAAGLSSTKPQEAVTEPSANEATAGEDAPPIEPQAAPESRYLVTYREAADALGVTDGTVRGWTYNGKVRKFTSDEGGVLVDLRECQRVRGLRPAGV